MKRCAIVNENLFRCDKIEKPARDDIHALAKIFQMERQSWLDEQSMWRLGEYFVSVLNDHVFHLAEIQTESELEFLINRHLHMSLDEWYNGL